MGNPRAKVLGFIFVMLFLASIYFVARVGSIDARAWSLLALTALFALATVIAFFQEEEGELTQATRLTSTSHEDTEAQGLPDPAEAGFDVPIL